VAARTTPEAVKEILLRHYDTVNEPSLQAFIDSAASLVDYVVSQDADSILSKETQELTERWLAAHGYAHADQLYSQKQTGRASSTFQGKTGMHLQSTQYGQMAMMLDVTGTLVRLNNDAAKGGKSSAGLIWLGSDHSLQELS
jgi:hypothetical protein